MIYFLAILMLGCSIYLFKAGFEFEDKEAAGYLTKIRLIGTGLLLLIGAIALLVNPKIVF
jgi:hypothetical protein